MTRLRENLSSASSWAFSLGGLQLRGARAAVGSNTDLDSLIAEHFEAIGDPGHPSRTTLAAALHGLGGRPARVFETGTAAWGTQSTLLFSAYVAAYGGEVVTVDTRLSPARHARKQTSRSVRFVVGDSVEVMSRPWASRYLETADLVYLDSWDVNLSDPLPSAAHGLREFLACADKLKRGAMVLVDDTPQDIHAWGAMTPQVSQFVANWGTVPGKGALILKLVDGSLGFQIREHDYQLLIGKL